jgi:ribosomal protein S18 acetylase RimI-like enzyme
LITLRAIDPDELDAFAALGVRPERVASVRDYLERMLSQGAMRRAWLFLADDGGQIAGRVAFWTLPGHDVPHDLVLLDLVAEDTAVGAEIVGLALEEMRRLGAEAAGYVLDDPPAPPQWQDGVPWRVAALERNWFSVWRQTQRFRREPLAPRESPGRLRFRTLPEVGEAAFIAAVERVSTDTPDAIIAGMRRERGAAAAAHAFYGMIAEVSHEANWFELAYDAGDALFGLIMPTAIPSAGTIGYIGVVPEQRGQRYVDDLLARAETTLHHAGLDRIVADTDLTNAPMAAAFRRAGYDAFGTRREFRLEFARRSAAP